MRWAVQSGDILLYDAWYNATQNVWIKEVYEAAAENKGSILLPG
jgi:hypothetical protein